MRAEASIIAESSARPEATAARYVLQPRLELIPQDTGGVLLSLRPLLALRLNRQAYALLDRLRNECTVADLTERAPGLAPAEITAFLDSLTQRRLLLRQPPAPSRWPSVSVIIPAYGRHEATRACIQSLLALDYPKEQLEIIVVDDASEPPLAPFLTDLPARLLRQEHNIGQSAARNQAAALARGELLAFIDNDCLAEPGWLRAVVPYFTDPAVGIVGGRVTAPPGETRTAAFEAVRSPLDMGAVGGPVGPNEAVAYLPTCNLLARRELLSRQRGFAAELRLGEDVDLIWRALRQGWRACYAPEGRIVHYHRVRLPELLRRRADYGSSEAMLQTRHPEGRRVLPLPVTSLLLLGMLTALMVAWPVALGLGLLLTVLLGAELNGKRHRLRRLGVQTPLRRLSGAVWREHRASLYHLSASLTRYYGLPLLLACGLAPALLPATAVVLLAAPIGDYYRRRPALGLPAFIGLYWLEMAAYQVGVWQGCWRERTLKPLLPRLCWRR